MLVFCICRQRSMTSLVQQIHEGACGCRGGPLPADTLQQSQSLCSRSQFSLLSHTDCSVYSKFQSFTAFNAATIPLTFPDRLRRRPRRRQQRRPLQIFWHMCSLDLVEEVESFHTLQERPLAQSQRWKISKPWAPFFLCLVHTSPCLSTGLQILVQKWRAQQ